jgi:hypothetical protein
MQTYSLTRQHLKAFIICEIASVIFLTICSLSPLISQQFLHLLFYLSLAFATVSGVIHVKYLNRVFNITSRESFRICLLLSFIPVLTSLLISAIFYYLLALPYDFLTFQIGFLVPFIAYQAYASYIGIPEVEYKIWSYPYFDQSPDTDDRETSVTEIIQLVLNKEPGSKSLTSFTLNVPVSMPVGNLFFSFINKYNKTHANQEILYADEHNRRFGWLFFIKRGWLMKKLFIDPDLSFLENGVKKNDILYATRKDNANREQARTILESDDIRERTIPL